MVEPEMTDREACPKIREMIAALQGFSKDIAVQVYRYDINGPYE